MALTVAVMTERCLVVGVVNCTPDSFSDAGRYGSADQAVADAVAMVESGADWIDIGGESTRPGSSPVTADEEQRRVLEVVRRVVTSVGKRARVSIDTYHAETAHAALAAGATIVNDISGGAFEPMILDVVAEAGATLVLGHSRGRPATMMDDVHFDDVVGEVAQELALAIARARAAGCREVWADPGIGFGKRTEHNLALLRDLPTLRREVGVPLMVGVSRKAFLGHLTKREPSARIFGTAAAVTAAVLGGADAVRVHDVVAMVDVVRVAEALRKSTD